MAKQDKAESAGEAVRRIYSAKAAERDMALDEDDQIVLELAAQTADDIAALDHEVAANGVMVGSEANPKTNPALIEVRAQRLVLGKLMADLDRRLGIAAQGGASGFRGQYAGDGSQNQRRDNAATAKRGQGRAASVSKFRGA